MTTLAALLLCRPNLLSCQMLPYERNHRIVRSFSPRPRVPDSPDVQFDLQSLAKDAAALSDITPRSKMRRLGDDVASGCHRSENISSLKLITDTQAGRRAKVAGMSIDAHEQDLAKREIAALRLFEELPAHVLQELGWSGKQAFSTSSILLLFIVLSKHGAEDDLPARSMVPVVLGFVSEYGCNA